MLGDAHDHSGYIEPRRFLFYKLDTSYFSPKPVLPRRSASMAMFENFLISEQLGFFDSLNEKADNRYGVMVHFSEIEANTPAIWRPVNGGFGASIVNSF